MALKYGLEKTYPLGITGPVKTSVLADVIDLVDGELEQIDGEGTQTGQHPAKTQSKIFRAFG